MAVALATRSRVRLSLCVSDVCEEALLSDVAPRGLRERVECAICPSLSCITRLVELLSRICRRLRWREEFGAPELPGRCPQLSPVRGLGSSQECVISVSVSPGLPFRFSKCFFLFLIINGACRQLF